MVPAHTVERSPVRDQLCRASNTPDGSPVCDIPITGCAPIALYRFCLGARLSIGGRPGRRGDGMGLSTIELIRRIGEQVISSFRNGAIEFLVAPDDPARLCLSVRF